MYTNILKLDESMEMTDNSIDQSHQRTILLIVRKSNSKCNHILINILIIIIIRIMIPNSW